MRIEVVGVRGLRFDDGSPVRAASAVARHDDGWLVLQDDATHAARVSEQGVTRLRLLPPVEGLDTFAEHDGTKHLKPDLEAACEVEVDGVPAVLVLGSGSTSARTRAVLVGPGGQVLRVVDLATTYDAVAAALGLVPDELNLEGACVVDGALRCFHRGLPAIGRPGAAVDLALAPLLGLLAGRPSATEVVGTRLVDLRAGDGTDLAVTDAVHLGEGLVLVSAVAEDAPDAYADGPVTASALALLHDGDVRAVAALPAVAGRVAKVEGLALVERHGDGVRLLATADLDDPAAASPLLSLQVSW